MASPRVADSVRPLEITRAQPVGHALEEVAKHAARYTLVLVLLWIGAMKFTDVEAEAIRGLVANSPLMSWMYAVMSVGVASALIGVAGL